MKKVFLLLISTYTIVGAVFASQYYLSYKSKPTTSFPNNLNTFILNTILWPLSYSKFSASEVIDIKKDPYIKCPTATTTDDNQNVYTETRCEFTEIYKGDSFLVDIGNGKQVIFTYNGTSSDPRASGYVEFDSEQENAWQYQIVGSQSNPQKLTFQIGDGMKMIADLNGFSFRDMNYDGYLDLIDGRHQGAGANSWRFIYWFDPSTNTFKTPDSKNDGSVLDTIYSESNFDMEKRTYVFYGTSGPDGSYSYNYVFLNGKWILTRSWYSSPNDTGKYCIEKEKNLINGKMVEKETSTPREEDEHC